MMQRTASQAQVNSRLIPFVAAGFLLLTTPGNAQVEVQIFPASTQVAVTTPFSDEHHARTNISGAACTAIGARGCLAVNDTSNFAQFFSLSAGRIAAGPTIDLQPDHVGQLTFSSVDAEGAASDGEHFYVVGSRAKTSPASDDGNFLAFRLGVDLTKPPLPGPLVPAVQRSVRLRDAIDGAMQAGLFGIPVSPAPTFEIEGVAVKDGRMFVGFRAPATDGAFLMSVDAGAVFTTANLNTAVRKLQFGHGAGIRDLAAISTGILVLSGPAVDQPGAPSLFHFDPTNGALVKLGTVAEPTNRKADTLLVLQEDPEFLRFVLMFDGVENGGPIEYFVSR
jgi:hypothetical protein